MKTKILIISLAVIFVVLLLVTLLGSQSSQVKKFLPPIIQSKITPSPSVIPLGKFDPELENRLEKNYAADRLDYLKNKPWLLKLPFKSANYVISYDPENDLFLATIYYSTSSAKLKNDQLDKARSDVTDFLKTIDASSAGRIKFTETFKKGI